MGTKETPLQAAVNSREDADRRVAEVLRQQYPPGAGINWEHGARVMIGRVVEHLYGDRIRVKNAITGKTRDIYAYQVARAEHLRK